MARETPPRHLGGTLEIAGTRGAGERLAAWAAATRPGRVVRWVFERWWLLRTIRAARLVAIGMGLLWSGREIGMVEYALDPGA